ncbi:MAG: site-specific integrase [Candidatus Cloacimonetes bacterium]|nr:site-specific integrase [Candidatus Cloacimonadota bacterium]
MSNKKIESELKANLKKINHRKRIKLRYKTTKDEGFSLYLDFWNGTNREYYFLKIYLGNKTGTYFQDLNLLKTASAIRDKKEFELIEQNNDFKIKSLKQQFNFIDYIESILTKKQKDDHVWQSTIKHLRDYAPGAKIKDINQTFCVSFVEYLKNKTDLNINSISVYFSKLKASINQAVKENIIQSNPANGIQIKKNQSEREFLTLDELRIIKEADCPNIEIKKAFLFSCFTGLRLSDIRALTFDQVQGEYLSFIQEKTDGHLRMKMSKNAIELIEQQRDLKESGQVFHLPFNVSEIIRTWVSQAGINKHITFHCARHTFATLALTSDIDLFTVSKLLGHSDIKTTQIYAKLIDKKKDEAVDKLPEI